MPGFEHARSLAGFGPLFGSGRSTGTARRPPLRFDATADDGTPMRVQVWPPGERPAGLADWESEYRGPLPKDQWLTDVFGHVDHEPEQHLCAFELNVMRGYFRNENGLYPNDLIERCPQMTGSEFRRLLSFLEAWWEYFDSFPPRG